METEQIKYEEVLSIVQRLPANQIIKLKAAIERKFFIAENSKKSDFQEFLLNAPVMTDDEYKSFLKSRKHFNQWRKAV